MLRTLVIIYVLLLLTPAVPAQEKQSYLLVENPQKLTFLNKYQQQLTSFDLRNLIEYTPFLITKEHTFFDDGLRSYIMVEAEGEEYYLLTDDKGKVLNLEFAGITKKFKRKTAFTDTVNVTKENKVRQRIPGNTGYSYVTSGQKFIRVFKDVSEYYVYNLEGRFYCWLKLPGQGKNSGWEIYKEEFEVYKMPRPELEEKLIAKIEEFNELFSTLVNYFNKKFSKEVMSPGWEIKISYEKIVINIKDETSAFEKTIYKMKKELLEVISISAYSFEETETGITIFN